MWRYFTREEVGCKCGCTYDEHLHPTGGMDAEFMGSLDELRHDCGFPLPVTSGFRCRRHDERVGSSSMPGGGPHTTGRAVDIRITDAGKRDRLVALSRRYGFVGIGVARGFVHLDMCYERNRPALWVY